MYEKESFRGMLKRLRDQLAANQRVLDSAVTPVKPPIEPSPVDDQPNLPTPDADRATAGATAVQMDRAGQNGNETGIVKGGVVTFEPTPGR